MPPTCWDGGRRRSRSSRRRRCHEPRQCRGPGCRPPRAGPLAGRGRCGPDRGGRRLARGSRSRRRAPSPADRAQVGPRRRRGNRSLRRSRLSPRLRDPPSEGQRICESARAPSPVVCRGARLGQAELSPRLLKLFASALQPGLNRVVALDPRQQRLERTFPGYGHRRRMARLPPISACRPPASRARELVLNRLKSSGRRWRSSDWSSRSVSTAAMVSSPPGPPSRRLRARGTPLHWWTASTVVACQPLVLGRSALPRAGPRRRSRAQGQAGTTVQRDARQLPGIRPLRAGIGGEHEARRDRADHDPR